MAIGNIPGTEKEAAPFPTSLGSVMRVMQEQKWLLHDEKWIKLMVQLIQFSGTSNKIKLYFRYKMMFIPI